MQAPPNNNTTDQEIASEELAAYRGLPRHEGYALDAAAHDRRRRAVFLVAGIFTVALASGWLIALSAGITGGNGTPEGQAVAETRERLTEQFSRIGAALDRGAPTGTPASAASATASLQEAVAAIRAQLQTSTATPR